MKDKICVIGMGYVGLPLAVAFAEKYSVVGFDINFSRVQELEAGQDSTLEVSSKELQAVKDLLKFTNNAADIRDANIYIVTVPTPIDRSNKPDLSPLEKASETVGSVLKAKDIVIYESTVYPGVTEEVCVPVLEKVSKLSYNQDFFCGYSPERINPGDKQHTVKNILKVTSGSTPETAERVDALYSSIITAGTHLASSIKVAEASKVIENTQRDVNIALINELAMIFNEMGINTDEVIEAAATKWNFIKLKPGLVGGHCIGVDPYYLTYKAEELGYKPNLILSSRQINNGMGKYVADATIKELIDKEKLVKNANVLILGYSFKENCPDVRNTRVVDVVENLYKYGVNVHIHDPWVAKPTSTDGLTFVTEVSSKSNFYDAIILAVNHDCFSSYTENDFAKLVRGKFILIDVKSVKNFSTWKL
ncbi:nucleotide sugar dehydrogenase [Idiomarina loihiensis]|uniref:UDP-N-acetyl-D-mannosaminuronate dehydrogenase n=1 Tax=Idiomarina loihiensis (strain ATCC BAA-735 / DSM 15497 / L2-TR) TaxID=283942 RepID=Q5QWU7_IDILO|nr:nucleotide sugar dehydrogenase [Idiomarina loihiensis]AAV81397.1 UDP-N-acetyl-D-mannosaminuronate dehydrogenase [Idiomarina loihiensis L2TR]AGM35424.1 UDP-N-acetyl-D-mannosaminuronate dehydrogenase [Idiomarina loihiensis GSL 199]